MHADFFLHSRHFSLARIASILLINGPVFASSSCFTDYLSICFTIVLEFFYTGFLAYNLQTGGIRTYIIFLVYNLQTGGIRTYIIFLVYNLKTEDLRKYKFFWLIIYRRKYVRKYEFPGI